MAAVRRVNNVLHPGYERQRMLDLLITYSVRYDTYTLAVSELKEESGEVGLLQYYRFSYSCILDTR